MRYGLLVMIAQLVACFPGCAEAQRPNDESAPAVSTKEPVLLRGTAHVIKIEREPSGNAASPVLIKPKAKLLRHRSKTALRAMPAVSSPNDRHENIKPPIPALVGQVFQHPVQHATLDAGSVGQENLASPVANAAFLDTETDHMPVAVVGHEGPRPVRSARSHRSLVPVGSSIEAPATSRAETTANEPVNATLAKVPVGRSNQVLASQVVLSAAPTVAEAQASPIESLERMPPKHPQTLSRPSRTTGQSTKRTKLATRGSGPVGAIPRSPDLAPADGSLQLRPFVNSNINEDHVQERNALAPRRRRHAVDAPPPVGTLPLQVEVNHLPLAYNRHEDDQPEVSGLHAIHPRTVFVDSVSEPAARPWASTLESRQPLANADATPAIERVGHLLDRNHSTRRQQSTSQTSSSRVRLTELQVGRLPRTLNPPLPHVQTAAVQDHRLLPVPAVDAPDNAKIEEQANDLVALTATDAELRSVLRLIANHHKLSLVIGPEVTGPVTVNIRKARLEEVLDAILGVAGFHWHRSGNLLFVTGANGGSLDPRVQGRRLQVYALDYVSATDVEQVVNSLLSPIGQAFVSQSSEEDKLKTRETIVVEDNELGHSRVAEYLAQIDVPPQQVLIEAHVLQIDLEDDNRHGVNLSAIARVAGANVTLSGSNFVDSTAENPAVSLRVDGTDMQSLIEAIQAQTNSRTLASPKVSVVNRQVAKVQIGQRLPFAVATTTQTATIQNVQFLDVGVVLTVTPVITEDGNILMSVLPKVSGGRITESGFPEEDTTQVETTVLMPDGGGLIIGGLIRESDESSNARLPKLGRLPVVKHLFSRQSQQTRRNELVVAMVTHVIHSAEPPRSREAVELHDTLPPYAQSELRYQGYAGDAIEGEVTVPDSRQPMVRIID